MGRYFDRLRVVVSSTDMVKKQARLEVSPTALVGGSPGALEVAASRFSKPTDRRENMERSTLLLVLGTVTVTLLSVVALVVWRPESSLLELGAFVTIVSLALERVVRLVE